MSARTEAARMVVVGAPVAVGLSVLAVAIALHFMANPGDLARLIVAFAVAGFIVFID